MVEEKVAEEKAVEKPAVEAPVVEAAVVEETEEQVDPETFLKEFDWEKYEEGIEAVEEEKLKEFDKALENTVGFVEERQVIDGTVVRITDREAIIDALCQEGDRRFGRAVDRGAGDRVTTGHWKERMHDGGYHGRRGLPLPLLGQVVKDSLAAYDLTVRSVDITQTPKNEPQGSPLRTRLKKRLREFDRRGSGLLIAHRLSTVRLADRILVLRRGNLVDQGDEPNGREFLVVGAKRAQGAMQVTLDGALGHVEMLCDVGDRPVLLMEQEDDLTLLGIELS